MSAHLQTAASPPFPFPKNMSVTRCGALVNSNSVHELLQDQTADEEPSARRADLIFAAVQAVCGVKADGTGILSLLDQAGAVLYMRGRQLGRGGNGTVREFELDGPHSPKTRRARPARAPGGAPQGTARLPSAHRRR